MTLIYQTLVLGKFEKYKKMHAITTVNKVIRTLYLTTNKLKQKRSNNFKKGDL